MSKIKCVFFVICLFFASSMLSAQVKDSIPVKSGLFSKLNFSKIQFPKIHLPKVNLFKKDTTIVKVTDTTKKSSWLSKFSFTKKNAVKTDSTFVAVSKSKEVINVKVKDTTSLYKTMEQKFLQYTATTTVSLLAGANFSKQNVDAGGYRSNYNYASNDINEDVYKTGYFGGIRLDGLIKKKHEYSLSFNFSKITSGANYLSSSRLTPVVGNFSPFKAEDYFFVMNVAAHYKKLIPYGDLTKFKFYLVAGPSFDARISKASLDNKVTNAYKQIFIKGDLGVEFNNRSLYTLFLHYNHNIGSLTKSPIQTNLNSFQLGIMVKATDLL